MNDTNATTGRIALAFAAVYLIWGSTYLAIRFAVETMPPFLMAGVRYLIAGLILYGWLRLRGAGAPTRRDWRMASIAGGLMLVGGNGILSWAEQFVPSGLAALLVATVPIWFVGIAWLGPDREAPNGPEIVGIVLGLVGVGVLMSGSIEGIGLHGASPGLVVWSSVAVIVATIAWAAGSMYSRRAPMPRPTLYATALIMCAGGALSIVSGLALGEAGRLDLSGISGRSLASLAYLIVFGSIVAFSAYGWLVKAVRPALLGTYAYVNPVVAVFLGWWLAGEPVTGHVAVGAALVVAAVVLVERGRAKARRLARSGVVATSASPPPPGGPGETVAPAALTTNAERTAKAT